MSKDTSGGSKNLKPKIFGATPLQVGEDDVSRLIGGIVEKGFSQVPQTRPLAPPSAPRPTVLPFPAARHRSHGPHWAPKVGNSNLHNDNDNDNEDDHTGEEGDFDGMETAADVANPVQRKEKKGLDFSRWREIVEKDAKSANHEMEKGGYSNGMEVGQKDKKMASNGLRRPVADRDGAKLHSVTMGDNASKIEEVKEETRDTSLLASAKEFHSFKHGKNENGVQTKQYQQDGSGESEGSTVVEEPSTRENEVRKEMDLKMQNMQKSYAASGFSAQKLGGGEKDSLQSEIDSENRARLADMSVDDIAEAHAEIMAKMNPELMNALKKRGQAKAKRQKSSLTDVSGSASNGMGGEEALSKSSENTVSSPNVSPDKGGIWNAWSKRVERVRDMRFSIDGDIIGFGLESDIGLYDSNNVSRRDYLRTEGDPGAAGYTIKEAIALARSVVPGQRTLALSVISSILNRAIYSIIQNQVDVESADWVAIWAYALGSEPELALSLRSRWLGAKKKCKATSDISCDSQKSRKKDVRSLETIHEDTDAANEVGEESSSLMLEWAHQRLPLPAHWFLSAISTIPFDKKACPPGASYKVTQTEVPSDVLEVAKSRLFFLPGIEAIPTFLGSNIYFPVNGVPVVWKLHAMSATLLSWMGVLEDEKSRDVYETLQNMYGEALDETTPLFTDELGSPGVESLKFKPTSTRTTLHPSKL